MKGKIILTLSVFFLASAAPAFAQVLSCGEGDTVVSVGEVLDNVNSKCCDKKGKVRQRTCLARRAKEINQASTFLGDFAANSKLEIDELRTSSCEDTTVDLDGILCSEVSAETVVSTVSGACCGLEKRQARVNCLSRASRKLKKNRGVTGRAFFAAISPEIKTLKRADSCGGGGKGKLIPAQCDTVRKNSDGALGGWLHKPAGDHTRGPVNLFPSEDSPNSCAYLNRNGKKFMDARTTGRANGNRVHIRPVNDVSCSEFPRGMYLSCNNRGRNVCYQVPDPCRRYD